MRFPCSYMIDSAAFANLPPAARRAVHRRLDEVLSGRENGSKYAHLSQDDRTAITEILRETRR